MSKLTGLLWMALSAAPFLLMFPGCGFYRVCPGGPECPAPSPSPFLAGDPPRTSAIFCSIETYSRCATQAEAGPDGTGVDIDQAYEQGFWKPKSSQVGLIPDATCDPPFYKRARVFRDAFPDGSAVCLNPGTIPGEYATADEACKAWCASQGWVDNDGNTYRCDYIAWLSPGVPETGSLPNVCDMAGTMLAGTDPRKFWTAVVGAAGSVGSDLTKNAADMWGNAGAVSARTLDSGDGAVQITASETTTFRIFGLGNEDTNNSFEDVEWGLLLATDGMLAVVEAGGPQVVVGTYATGDVLEVGVEGGAIVYKKNGAPLQFERPVPPPPLIYPLRVDSALYSQGATLKAARTSF